MLLYVQDINLVEVYLRLDEKRYILYVNYLTIIFLHDLFNLSTVKINSVKFTISDAIVKINAARLTFLDLSTAKMCSGKMFGLKVVKVKHFSLFNFDTVFRVLYFLFGLHFERMRKRLKTLGKTLVSLNKPNKPSYSNQMVKIKLK